MDTPEWARELGRHIFTAETKANGGAMEGGYGFLSPQTKELYEGIALRTVLECQQAASDPVKLEFIMRELRASLIARTVRHSLRRYGHKAAESVLPECIAVDVEQSLAADENRWGRDCGENGGPLTEARDCIGSAYTRRHRTDSTN